MVILFGNRIKKDTISMISARLKEHGIENECVQRASKRGVMDAVRDGVDAINLM